jgi:hypothetical protein
MFFAIICDLCLSCIVFIVIIHLAQTEPSDQSTRYAMILTIVSVAYQSVASAVFWGVVGYDDQHIGIEWIPST